MSMGVQSSGRGPLRLRLLEAQRHVRLLVVSVQWIASGDQAIARRRGAVAESPTNPLTLNRPSLQRVPQYLGIGQYHPSQADRIDPTDAYGRLRHVRQVILQ